MRTEVRTGRPSGIHRTHPPLPLPALLVHLEETIGGRWRHHCIRSETGKHGRTQHERRHATGAASARDMDAQGVWDGEREEGAEEEVLDDGQLEENLGLEHLHHPRVHLHMGGRYVCD